MTCFEAQKDVFLSFKNSFLEAVAGSEKNLKHCKNKWKSKFVRLTNSLKNICFWVSKRDVLKSQKSLKNSHFLASCQPLFSYFLAVQKNKNRLKHCKHQCKTSFLDSQKQSQKDVCLASKTTLFGSLNSLKITCFWFCLYFFWVSNTVSKRVCLSSNSD